MQIFGSIDETRDPEVERFYLVQYRLRIAIHFKRKTTAMAPHSACFSRNLVFFQPLIDPGFNNLRIEQFKRSIVPFHHPGRKIPETGICLASVIRGQIIFEYYSLGGLFLYSLDQRLVSAGSTACLSVGKFRRSLIFELQPSRLMLRRLTMDD